MRYITALVPVMLSLLSLDKISGETSAGCSNEEHA
jgi:hypothetical protein